MTQAQLGKRVTSAINSWVTNMIVQFYNHVKRHGEVEARRMWREEYGLVFRRQYTVSARFFHYKGFPWKELPKESKQLLLSQRGKAPRKSRKLVVH